MRIFPPFPTHPAHWSGGRNHQPTNNKHKTPTDRPTGRSGAFRCGWLSANGVVGRHPTWGGAPGYGAVGLQPTGGKSNTKHQAPSTKHRPTDPSAHRPIPWMDASRKKRYSWRYSPRSPRSFQVLRCSKQARSDRRRVRVRLYFRPQVSIDDRANPSPIT